MQVLGLLVGVLLVVAACGDDDDDAGAGGPRTVMISAPTSGSQVGTSVEFTLAPSFEIGEPDTGRPHIHLHFDGSPEYEIVYETTHTVSDLAPGMHSVVAVVANPDHSETDVRSPEVTFDVSDQASSPAPDGQSPQPATTVGGGSDGGDGGSGGISGY
jgi:hypothetical protein